MVKPINEIIESDLFYRSLFEYSPNIVFFLDHKGIIVKSNEAFSKILGYTNDEIELDCMGKFINSSEIPLYREAFNKVLSGEIQNVEVIFLHKNGSRIHTDLTIIPAKFEGNIIGMFGISKDITKEKQTERLLRELELKFGSIVDESSMAVYIIQNEQIVYGNPRLQKILGSEFFTIGLNIWETVYPEDHSNLKSTFDQLIEGEEGIDHYFRIMRKDGTVIDIEAHSKKIYYQNKPTIIGTFQDITQRKKAEDLNRYLSYYDSLTDLPNRRLFQEKLEQELIISRTLQKKLAIMYLDLDRFKYINDTLGHYIGDKLLKQISRRLKICLGENNVVARLGGDEFAVLSPNVLSTNQIINDSKTIIESLEVPFLIEGYKLFITTSIGISLYPNDGEDSHTLMKNADLALYKSKEKGKNTYHIYTPSMNVQTYKTFTLESDLRNAIELNQLELYYQPKVLVNTSQIVGVEALLRWNHPEWGIISPIEFIPLAEEIGLITEIGKWVKRSACLQNKAWQDAGLPAIPVSINLSAKRFLEQDLITSITDILKETKLDPKYLEIEITETSLLANEKVVLSILDELRDKGIRISLDDFGTGYSSLSYLKLFKGRIDTLKLDRSFIKNLSQTDLDGSNYITQTIIQLAQNLKMNVIAEGVENNEQLQVLKEYKCNLVQGYLFSEPIPADDFAKLLQKGKLEVSEGRDAGNEVRVEDQREFFRIQLDFPLSSSMTLIRIHGRKVELGRTEVLLEDIGLGGVRFLSNIRLAVHPDIILEFETEILGNMVKMHGSVVWMREVRSGIYQYGLEFMIDESERSVLAQLLNKLAILLRKNPLVPDCSFIKIDRYNFFEIQNEKK